MFAFPWSAKSHPHVRLWTPANCTTSLGTLKDLVRPWTCSGLSEAGTNVHLEKTSCPHHILASMQDIVEKGTDALWMHSCGSLDVSTSPTGLQKNPVPVGTWHGQCCAVWPLSALVLNVEMLTQVLCIQVLWST